MSQSNDRVRNDLVEEGNQLVDDGRYAEALAVFSEGVSDDPDRADVYYHNQGYVYFKLKEYQRAIVELNAAIVHSRRPRAKSFAYRGLCYQKVNEMDRALEDFRKAVSLDPKDAGFRCMHGVAYELVGKWANARDEYVQAITIDAEHLCGHRNLGALLATCPDDSVRDGAKSLHHALEAFALEYSWESLAVVAAAYAERRLFAQAILCAKEALAIAPPEIWPERQARLALYQSGQPYRRPS